ncbi:MAG: 30S ribosomal protein S12 methylthiotransferase RimO [Muribaculaceae bacterium]|nr:30S ribosomal protein S12 methylthiotransferase RimO [Muribaculaceae bacterium]
MAKQRVNVITLGCSKNLVDSERILKLFKDAGLDAVHESTHRKGDIIIINTCGFIGDAKEESIETILQYTTAKLEGEVSAVYVMGCLSERYGSELTNEIPEVDAWYGKFNWKDLVTDITHKHLATVSYDRVITTPSHHAYLKIAEGCNRFCAFCAIPIITGRYTSRPIEEILEEVKMLVNRGVKEFNLIAQDLTNYGVDIYNTVKLPELIDAIASIDGVKWIRLHYAYPTHFPLELLDVIAKHDNVCKYLDIALQHINNDVLSNMRRHITAEETRQLLKLMRERVPNIHIRTTLMVGFPGETEEAFDDLLNFVKEQRFERMGAFAYCEEDDTYAAKHLEDTIPEDVKQNRLSKLMQIQEQIALEVNESKIGQTLQVIIDREENDYYIGRTQWDSPEVDPEVLIKKDTKLQIGEFYNALITGAMPFELMAEIIL